MDTSKIRIIKLMDAVDVVEEETVEGMEEEEEEEEGASYDEHIWTSPKNAVRIVQAIADALCDRDKANASIYRQNAAAYIAKLNELDAAFQAVVDSAKRKTIVFGDRFPFRYFADRYGLDYYAAFPGCSTETEPSAATVAFLINKIKVESIPVIFHIELSNERMADTIAGETGAKKRLFHAVHNISKRDFDRGVTYLELMTRNVDVLREALQ
jgi:zinc transport system substrate-binding protein